MELRRRDSDGTSLGIKLLAGVIGLCATVPAVVGLAIAADTHLRAGEFGSLAIAGFLLLLGVGLVLVAAGLWIGVYGAWWWALVLYAGSAGGGAVAGITAVEPAVVVSAIVSALIAWYLYRCREQFESDIDLGAELQRSKGE